METPVPEPSPDPRAEYVRRLDAWKTTQTLYDSRHRRLGVGQLLLGGVTLVVIGLALAAKLISVLWVLAPLSAIVVLAVIHERVLKRRGRCSRTVAYYERALARINNRWMGTGETGERFQSASHPYSRDLDVFGVGSLFELLSTARTRVGQETLAKWLLAPASPDQVHSRQAAVADLRTRLDLREDLAVLAEEARSLAPAEVLAAWGEGKPLLASRLLRFVSAMLACLWLLSLAVWMVWGLGYPALVISAVNVSLNLAYRRRVGKAVSDAESAAHDLGLFAAVLARLEAEQFEAPRLVDLREALQSQGRPPSVWIARLNRLMEYLDSRRNLIVKSIDFFVLWTLQCACAVEAWRKQTGPAVRGWLATVGEFEALSALGGYAYEHPADVFPEFAETSPCFEAEGLAHPLLLDRDAVRNDLRLGGNLRVLIISGPNMAGKSTLVRAVGISAVLAQCGAPVRARRLRLSPLAVGASICVLDSLQGGISRFYAEIRRLKQIIDLTQGPLAVLFLLDEFLQGTNSQDRRLGAEAMVRRLVERGAIGLVTTHDLALAQIAEGLRPRAANAHFQDRLEDGKLIFDYRLQPGVVETSNALNLMRSIGLDV
ncbi:MAG TPA: DNA mismatch repair protein MutS [Terriglobia bacterium]|nr:DNA mismatch repair protein MutS [Terriglobia bacterium]